MEMDGRREAGGGCMDEIVQLWRGEILHVTWDDIVTAIHAMVQVIVLIGGCLAMAICFLIDEIENYDDDDSPFLRTRIACYLTGSIPIFLYILRLCLCCCINSAPPQPHRQPTITPPPTLSFAPPRTLNCVSYDYYKHHIKDANTDDDNALCPICLEDFEAVDNVVPLQYCKHVFHGECIDAWLRRSRYCPVCRRFCPRTLYSL